MYDKNTMNYKKHYDNLITTRLLLKEQRVKEKQEGKYFEKHHILPRSQGGTDDKSNIVLLTGREHFIAHWLLVQYNPIRPNIMAFWRMCNGKSIDRNTISAKVYEYAKTSLSNSLKGRKLSETTRKKISDSKKGNKYMLGRVMTDYTKNLIGQRKKGHTCYIDPERSKKISIGNTGKKRTKECKNRMSKNRKGCIGTFTNQKHTEESKLKISKTKKGQTYTTKMINKYTLDGLFIHSYKSQKEAADSVNKPISLISRCCNNKIKKAYGFKWEFA